jgi:hypothetical protein
MSLVLFNLYLNHVMGERHESGLQIDLFLPMNKWFGLHQKTPCKIQTSETAFYLELILEHAVAKLVEALCWKPEGRGLLDFFLFSWPFQLHYSPDVDSASDGNEYQKSSLGVTRGQRIR